ncbi:MAG: TetR/AcrR family transcriptional regulator [Dehalobacterium sp.]
MKELDLTNNYENNLSFRIIEAAKKLFMENGFKGTTTKMIAEEAGVNEATIFRHFKTKEGIFVEISKEITEYSHKKLEKIMESDLPPEEMFFQFGMGLYSLIVESKGILIMAIIESRRRSDLVHNVTQTLATTISILEKKLVALWQAGKLQEGDFYTASLIYVESLIGLFIVQNRLAGEMIPIEIERLCRSTSKILLYGMSKDKVN